MHLRTILRHSQVYLIIFLYIGNLKASSEIYCREQKSKIAFINMTVMMEKADGDRTIFQLEHILKVMTSQSLIPKRKKFTILPKAVLG